MLFLEEAIRNERILRLCRCDVNSFRLSSFLYNKSLHGMFVFNLTRKAIVELILELLIFDEFQTIRCTYS